MDDYQNIFNTVATIIDMGSYNIKTGLSGEDKPSFVFRNIIGTPKYQKILPISCETEVVDPSEETKGLYRLRKPIERGMVSDYDDLNLVFSKVYKQLKIHNNKEIPVFITETPFTPHKQKSRIAELLFESYDCPNLFFGIQGVLSLYAFGKTDGIILESGDGVTQVVPVYNGYKLDHAMDKIDFGGQDITEYLKYLLRTNGRLVETEKEQDLYNKVKESECVINPDREKNKKKFLRRLSIFDMGNKPIEVTEYELPDGECIKVGEEKFMTTEVLFNPSIAGKNHPGIHELLADCLERLDMDLKRHLINSIYLSGGNSMFKGFNERLNNELEPIVSDPKSLNITAGNFNKTYSVWQGASSITNINAFSKLWISRKDYKDHGDRVFLMKSF